ncbi:MAG: hypothetical protein ACXVDD_08755, partial [Polyangia bacterium]
MSKLGLVFAIAIIGCGGSTPTGGGGAGGGGGGGAAGGGGGGGGAAGGGGGGGGGDPMNWLAGARGTLASSRDGLNYQLSPSNVTSADLWALTCSGPQIGWAA